MEILKYKGFEGSADIDMTRAVCHGKVLFIDDLVTYEAATPAELQREFELAVDDYIETCTKLGREAKKPLKGQFNVRVTPELHMSLTLKARAHGVTLNEMVSMACRACVTGASDIHHRHEHFITVRSNEETFQTVTTSASFGMTVTGGHGASH